MILLLFFFFFNEDFTVRHLLNTCINLCLHDNSPPPPPRFNYALDAEGQPIPAEERGN